VQRLAIVILESGLIAVGCVLAAFALYLLVLALAAAVDRIRPGGSPRGVSEATRVAVLVPAHDEVVSIGGCIAALHAQTVSRDRYEVVVVADNCTDETASVARGAGARVLERDAPDARGKGRALRFAMDRLLTEQPPFDAIVVVDADATAERAFLAGLLEAHASGADVAQGESLLVPDASSRSQLRAAAYILINRVRPAGRARLGLPCDLQGNGMLFSRETLEAHPWNAFTSAEDLDYTIRLRRAGVRIRFVPGAIVHSPTAPTSKAAELQSLRWEGGKVHIARAMVPALVADAVRRGRLASLDAAFGLLVPPLALLAGLSAAGAGACAILASVGAVSWWTLAPYVASLAAITGFAFVGLWAGRAPGSAYRALAFGPALAVRKLVRIRRLFTHRADSWVRTERAADDEP
jgi:cellulose synthase/poly-beta-1,6-N-acetylglucosamine synthase-like glycosyltransferase